MEKLGEETNEERLKRLESIAKERAQVSKDIKRDIEENPTRFLSAEGLIMVGQMGLDRALKQLEQTKSRVELDKNQLSELIRTLEERDSEDAALLVARLQKVTGTEDPNYKYQFSPEVFQDLKKDPVEQLNAEKPPKYFQKMTDAYVGHIVKTKEEGNTDWSGYDKLVRLANTEERNWDEGDRAAIDFKGWDQKDFAKLVSMVESDPHFQEVLAERG